MLLKNMTVCLLERVKRRTFALFFMVLDLRLVKIGCRETINFFYTLLKFPTPNKEGGK